MSHSHNKEHPVEVKLSVLSYQLDYISVSQHFFISGCTSKITKTPRGTLNFNKEKIIFKFELQNTKEASWNKHLKSGRVKLFMQSADLMTSSSLVYDKPTS